MMRLLTTCLLFLCTSMPAWGVELTIRPYLPSVTAETAVVAFRLSEPASAEVHVFSGDGKTVFTSPEPKREHFVAVDGLAPGKVYRYAVVAGGRPATEPDDPELQIRTAVRPGESFVFAVYGDPRPGDTQTSEHYEDVLDQILLAEPSFSLVLGDMVDDGSNPEHWRSFFDVSASLFGRSAVYAVRGDNDYAEGAGLTASYFPPLRDGPFAFEWGGTWFFALDAWGTRGEQRRSEFDAGSDQVAWLEEQLAREDVQAARFRVVFLHDPVIVSRGRASDGLQRALQPIFEKYGVDVVFSSWHLYERSLVNGVTYIITGGAGAEIIAMPPNPSQPSLAEALRHHYTRVDVHAGAMTLRAVADDGTVLDEYVLTPRADRRESAEDLRRTAARLRREIAFNAGQGLPGMELTLFSFDCSYCRRLLNKELPELADAENLTLTVHYYDLDVEGTYELFLNAGAKFGKTGVDLPAVFVGDKALGGEREIEPGLSAEVQEFQRDPIGYKERSIRPFDKAYDAKQLGENAFNALTLGVVMAAGLLDGVNPCAFTTIVFLVSYLTLFGAGRRKIVVTGLVFSLAVFLTYFFLGVAFHTAFKTILMSPALADAVNTVLLALVTALCAVSLFDFARFAGGADGAVLALPGRAKDRIEGLIRKTADNPAASIIAPFALGVVVSGMELTCTGQVYIPIVAMISEPAYRVSALSYLLAYNLAFIAPLLAVFGLTLAGVGVGAAARSRSFKAAVKLLTAAFFAVMAVILMYNLGWI